MDLFYRAPASTRGNAINPVSCSYPGYATMTSDIPTLIASIRAGEDTCLELREVSFRGRRRLFDRDEDRPTARLADMQVLWFAPETEMGVNPP